MKARFFLIKIFCGLLMPKDVWVGKTFGVYSQKWIIVFGRMDSRGVIQGATEEDIAGKLGK